MSYQDKHIPIHEPQIGFNLLAKTYKQYHDHLDSFEKGVFQKFLPRNMDNARIIDLGAGDGRTYKYLKNRKYKHYTACDIAPQLLKKHPGKVEKIVCDLEKKLPFIDNTYTLALSFFVIEYVQNIGGLCQEVYRILDKKGLRIIGYFLQRRIFAYTEKKSISFKIKQYHHTKEDIENSLTHAGFSLYCEEIFEKNTLLGYIRVAEK